MSLGCGQSNMPVCHPFDGLFPKADHNALSSGCEAKSNSALDLLRPGDKASHHGCRAHSISSHNKQTVCVFINRVTLSGLAWPWNLCCLLSTRIVSEHAPSRAVHALLLTLWFTEAQVPACRSLLLTVIELPGLSGLASS